MNREAEKQAIENVHSCKWVPIHNRRTRKKWRDRGADVRWIKELGCFVRVVNNIHEDGE